MQLIIVLYSITLGYKRHPGPRKNNVLKNDNRDIPLPIDENQDLATYTKKLQKNMWKEPMTRYFEINFALFGHDFDQELSGTSTTVSYRNILQQVY